MLRRHRVQNPAVPQSDRLVLELREWARLSIPITRLPSYPITRFLLGVALFTAAACSRVPPPPYSLAFALEGSAPRMLHAAEEIAVPLTVRNTGGRAWDAQHVHVSYHWLWLVPRELAKRSRTVPYHDGIRTELTDSVPPGGDLHVSGRLLAPDLPGVYWLQWDMVEEGVTWFAQVAPRQPRRLIVVLPTLSSVVAPLPLLVAILASLGLVRAERSGTRSAAFLWTLAIADLLWCAASLLSKPLILVHEALLEPTPTAYWLIVVSAVTPPLLALTLLPRRLRAWGLLACGAFVTLLILGDALYYRFFGDVLSVSAMLAVRQTEQVSGSIRSLIAPGMLWLVLDIPFALWLVLRITRGSRAVLSPAQGIDRGFLPVIIVLALVAVVGVLPTLSVLRASHLDQIFRDRAVMEQLGPLGYHAYDAWAYARSTVFRPAVSDAQVADARAWFATRAPLRAGVGPSFGAARDKNLIVIQVESLQDFVVDYRVGGQAVMPHLRSWTDEALRFTNVTDQTNQGRTSDAELTTMASLLPLDHGAAAFQYPGDHYVGLPRVLTEHGYSTLSAVAFEAGFWNRRVMHPAYGFQQSLFEPDFEMTEQIGWGLNDRDFLQQMVPRLTRLPRPFGAWLITLSLHHPFDDFPDKHKVLSLGPLERTSFGNYLHTMRFFDAALADFQSSLARAGLLDDTLLVVFGDHDAGFARDSALSATIGIGADEAAWALNDRIPWFIRLPRGRAPGLTGVRRIPAGQTDFAPTLLALVGIDPAPLPYVGRNLLGQPDDPPVVRPYGDWLDRTHLLLNRGGSEGVACYTLSTRTTSAAAACAASNEAARRTHEIAQLVVTAMLQQRLRDSLK
jgi:lipoteichoic acid synthase